MNALPVAPAAPARAKATDNVVRLMAAIAIGANLYITFIDLWLIVAHPIQYGDVIGRALVTAAVALPLHLRHVWFAVHGRRPRAGRWTVSALALVNLVGLSWVGAGWMLQFASLAVSLLIVVRGPWAVLALAAIVLPPAALTMAPELIPSGVASQVHPVYLLFALAWRTVMQYVPVRLIALLRQLETTRNELEARAVVRERLRIDRELRDGLGAPLNQLIANGTAAANAVNGNTAAAIEHLGQLVNDARATLAEVRRIVARYQGASLRTDIAAAAALLEAAGAHIEIVVDERLPLDVVDAGSRAALHDALAHALRGVVAPVYVLSVSRTEAGRPRITLAAHEVGSGQPERWQ